MRATQPKPQQDPQHNPLYDGCTVGDLVVSAIARGGDRVAFISDDARWTYRQLGALVSTVIQALNARGLQRGDAVATLSANRPEAFLITAAAYVMGLRLTWMNPTASEDEHAYILADSGVSTLFVDPASFAGRARVLAARVPGVQRLLCFGPNDGLGDDLLAAAAQFSPSRLQPQASPDDVCVLVYTCRRSSGVACSSLAPRSPITNTRSAPCGSWAAMSMSRGWRSSVSRSLPKPCHRHDKPSCRAAPGMSSSPSISALSRAWCCGCTSAKPTPKLPITAVVTPCQLDGCMRLSQVAWPS